MFVSHVSCNKSSTMDYDKYYDRKSDGTYVMHFPNNTELSEYEIREIFCSYGDVATVDMRGSSSGLCFIRYKSVEDCIKCMDGLRAHPVIRILPHKHKLNVQTPSVQTNDVENIVQKTSSLNKSNEKKIVPKCKKLKPTSKQVNNDKQEKRSHCLSDSGSTSPQPSLYDQFQSDRHLLTNIIEKTVLNIMAREKLSSCASSVADLTDIHMDPLLNKKIPSLRCPDEAKIDNSRKTPSMPANFTKPEYNIVPAHEVIVANIHKDISIHYILHLIHKHSPICVTLMKMIRESSLRYCHVYFKAKKEAQATEMEFDNFMLYGNRLIVLTPETLMKESDLM